MPCDLDIELPTSVSYRLGVPRLVEEVFAQLPGRWQIRIRPQRPPLWGEDVCDVSVMCVGAGGTATVSTTWNPHDGPGDLVARLQAAARQIQGQNG